MRKRVKVTGIALRRHKSVFARYRANFKKTRHLPFLGSRGLVLLLAVAAGVAVWFFSKDPATLFAVPPQPVEVRFVDAHFSHEERPEPSATKGFRNVSRFTLTVELKNNTVHTITARSADMYDKSGYFLLSCRVADKPRAVAADAVETVRCTNTGRLPAERVERLLKQICEIDINLAGKGLKTRIRSVPWPRADACRS